MSHRRRTVDVPSSPTVGEICHVSQPSHGYSVPPPAPLPSSQQHRSTLRAIGPSETLARAFAREHRLAMSHHLQHQYQREDSLDAPRDEESTLHQPPHFGSDGDGGEEEGDRRHSPEPQQSQLSAPPVVPQQQHVQQQQVSPTRRKKANLNIPLDFRVIPSIDDLQRNIAFSPLFPLPDDFTALLSPRRPSHTAGAGYTSPSVGACILSPRRLHLKPEFTHPAVVVAALEVKIRELSPKLLQRHGRASINWNRVRRVTVTPFHDIIGFSEATMYHCVLDIAPESAIMGSDANGSGAGGGSGGGYGSTSPQNNTNGSIAGWRKVWQRAKLSIVQRKRTSQLSGSCEIGAINNNDEAIPIAFSARESGLRSNGGGGGGGSFQGSLNNIDLFNNDSAASSVRGSLVLPPPPPFLVVKHYDTSVVESPTVLMRIARHLSATTAERMVANELFFYSKLSGFFCDTNSPFRCPKPMFISQKDRGDPGFVRYVCCGTGSGTVATIVLEDMQRSGFSFDHVKGEGLFDEMVIYSVLVALAYLHSAMWDRCHEPSLQTLEPAAIVLFVHRCSPKLQTMRSKNEFAKVNPKELLARWATYGPMSYLSHRSMRHMVHYICARWDLIREGAVEILNRRDTVLHGDVHYKNIGFRTKYASSSVGGHTASHSRRKSNSGPGIPTGASVNVGGVGNAAAGATGGGGGIGSPPIGAGMLQRYFSTDNATLLRENSHTTSSQPNSATNTAARRQSSTQNQNSNINRQSSGHASPIPVANSALGLSATCRSTNTQQGLEESDYAADPTTPNAKQTAERIDVQPCFLDYQSCGPGSIAAELLYFLCTSVPVEVHLDKHGLIMEIETIEALRRPSPSNITPPPTGGVLTSNSFAGLSLTTDTTEEACAAALAAAASGKARSASTSSMGGAGVQMTLGELLSFDIMLITTYYQNLDPQVQVAYPLHHLIHDVYLLARHWTACSLIDMASTPPQERAALKRMPEYARLIEWGERTAERVYVMCAAVFTEVDGRRPLATTSAGSGGGPQQHDDEVLDEDEVANNNGDVKTLLDPLDETAVAHPSSP